MTSQSEGRVTVSVIVVNWNGMEFIRQCLESLLVQSYRDFEIIVVDNDSSDGSAELVEKEFPQARLIRNNRNVGYAEGNNIGIKESSGDIICFFNPDAMAEKNWLSVMVSSLQSSETIGACAGKMYYLGDRFGKNAVFCTWSKVGPYSANPYNFHGDEPVSKVDYVTGAAMAVKRGVIDRVGLMDGDYFLYFDETDLCARMIRAGYDLLYIPTAVAWHAVSGLVSDSDKKTYFMERSRIRFAIKNFDARYIACFYAILLADTLMTFSRDMVRKDFTRSRIRCRAILWNMANLKHTLRRRKHDFDRLKKSAGFRPYNDSLPLSKTGTGE